MARRLRRGGFSRRRAVRGGGRFAPQFRVRGTRQWLGLLATTFPGAPIPSTTLNAFSYDFSECEPIPASGSKGGIITIHRVVGEFYSWSQATAAGAVETPSSRSLTALCIFLAKRSDSTGTFDETNLTQMLPFMEQVSQDSPRILFQRMWAARFIDDAATDFLAVGDPSGPLTNSAGGGSHIDVRVKRRYDSSEYGLYIGFAFASGTAANHRIAQKLRVLYSSEGAVA